MKRIILVFLCLVIVLTVQAQEKPEMADAFRQEGKIYVVVTIVLLVLGGLFLYLFQIDRKLNKIESQLKDIEDQP